MPNGVRYPRVGGTREHHFDGTSLEPRELPENAATPTRRVHAVLGVFAPKVTLAVKSDTCKQAAIMSVSWRIILQFRKPREMSLEMCLAPTEARHG